MTESCRPRPEANLPLPGYGHGDLELAAAASADGAAAQGGRDQAGQRQQSRRGSHEVHHRARAGGLLARRFLLAEVQPLPREKLLRYTLTRRVVVVVYLSNLLNSM